MKNDNRLCQEAAAAKARLLASLAGSPAGNEKEAALAGVKLADMVKKYHLTAADLADQEPELKGGFLEFKFLAELPQHHIILGHACAILFHVRMLIHIKDNMGARGKRSVVFAGERFSVEAAITTMGYLEDSITFWLMRRREEGALPRGKGRCPEDERLTKVAASSYRNGAAGKIKLLVTEHEEILEKQREQPERILIASMQILVERTLRENGLVVSKKKFGGAGCSRDTLSWALGFADGKNIDPYDKTGHRLTTGK